MDEHAILWLFGTLITLSTTALSGVVWALWGHVSKCNSTQNENSIKLAEIHTNVARIMSEIGDHEHGIRGWLHQQSQALTRHEMDIERLKR